MGRKGVSKRKPKQTKPLSNSGASSTSNTRSSGHSLVTSLVKDNGAPRNTGGKNPSAGSARNRNQGS